MLSMCMLCVITTAETLQDFVIETLSSHSTRVEKCATVKAPLKFGETKFIPCRPSVAGSVVRIRLTGQKAAVLTLCEVKIYGLRGKIIYPSPTNYNYYRHIDMLNNNCAPPQAC